MDQKKMREQEAKCIQENPPGCTSACPVHVDVRAMIAAVQKEDFKTGSEIFNRAVPFPRIISRICDQPCQRQCKRKEIDEPISVNALEKICIDNYEKIEKKTRVMPNKDQKVAVIGGGLSGLTVALELAKKGYSIVIFEAVQFLGGSIRNISESKLPQKAIEDDLSQIEKNALIEVQLNTAVGRTGTSKISLTNICEDFAAVYLNIGSGAISSLGLDLETDIAGNLMLDPVTFATSHPKVFAGGSMRWRLEKKSPITSISDGKSAANSIDRLLQNASLSANRDKEGSYPTTLYTNIEGIKPQFLVKCADPKKGYSKEEALLEAKRCLQCQCLECVKVCEYLAHYRSYPKRYIREIYNNLSIVMGIRHANKMFNSCSLCGLCEKVCPGGLNMGEICREARRVMVQKGKMPPSAHDFALRDMQFSISDKFVLNKHQFGYTTSALLFFPGCQLSASSPHHVRQLYEFLCKKITGGVGLSLGCCGAPADWAGQEDLFRETIKAIEKDWRSLDCPKVITGCPTCYSIFKRELPDMEVETIWTILDEIGLPENTGISIAPKAFAIHDACTTRHEKEVHAGVRSILQKLGHQIVELDHRQETTECCGYGGLMSFANRDIAKKVRARRIKQSEADYLAYCAMCRDNYASQGKRVYHLLDLIFGGDQFVSGEKNGPGFSERHENRARLKTSFLRDVWGETVDEQKCTIDLIIPERVKLIMEDRMILHEDITKVIAYAESSGNKFKNIENNTFIAYYQPVSVTYWVEYSPEGDGFLVHNAYCHRLEIGDKGAI